MPSFDFRIGENAFALHYHHNKIVNLIEQFLAGGHADEIEFEAEYRAERELFKKDIDQIDHGKSHRARP